MAFRQTKIFPRLENVNIWRSLKFVNEKAKREVQINETLTPFINRRCYVATWSLHQIDVSIFRSRPCDMLVSSLNSWTLGAQWFTSLSQSRVVASASCTRNPVDRAGFLGNVYFIITAEESSKKASPPSTLLIPFQELPVDWNLRKMNLVRGDGEFHRNFPPTFLPRFVHRWSRSLGNSGKWLTMKTNFPRCFQSHSDYVEFLIGSGSTGNWSSRDVDFPKVIWKWLENEVHWTVCRIVCSRPRMIAFWKFSFPNYSPKNETEFAIFNRLTHKPASHL